MDVRKEKVYCHKMGNISINNVRETSGQDFSAFCIVVNRLHSLLEADCEFLSMHAAPRA